MELTSSKFTIFIIFSMFLVLIASMTVQPALAAISVEITRASTTNGIPSGTFLNYGTLQIPRGQTTISVAFSYTGIRGPADTSPLNHFQCFLLPANTFISASAPYPDRCPNMPENNRMMTGTVIRNLGPGSYNFGVQVFNNAGSFRPSMIWTFTITEQPTPIDTSGAPLARVYKAYSYGMEATSLPSQYHSDTGQPTPYNNMYIVLQGLYPSATGFRTDILQSGVRTTFECKWDNVGSFEPCGRYIFVRHVTPGFHTVDFRAKNVNGQSGDSSEPNFYWCVTSCNVSYPPGFQPIRGLDVMFFGGAKDTSFYSGKNETISLKDLKEFPIINQTIGTNDTNVTSFSLKEEQVNQSGK